MKKLLFLGLFCCVGISFSAPITDTESASSELSPKHELSQVLVKRIYIEKKVINDIKHKCITKINVYLSPQQQQELEENSTDIFKYDGVDYKDELSIDLIDNPVCNTAADATKYSWLKKHKTFLTGTAKYNLQLNAKFYSETFYDHKEVKLPDYEGIVKDAIIIDHLAEDLEFTSDRGFLKENGSSKYTSKFDSLYNN